MTTSGNLSCGWERVEAVIAEPNLRDLIQGYWEELSPKDVPMDPDWEFMVEADKLGRFKLWVARNEHGTLAGFVSWHLIRHIAYRSTVFAIDGGHYLAPEYRGLGWEGIRMWRSCLDELRAFGVRVAVSHDNVLHPLPGFFKRLGFEVSGATYRKVL